MRARDPSRAVSCRFPRHDRAGGGSGTPRQRWCSVIAATPVNDPTTVVTQIRLMTSSVFFVIVD
jgi:hypothetical protein